MHKDVLKELAKPFNLKARKGVGGKIFKYVPSEDIVDRMNKVFSGNWSTEVMSSDIVEDNILVCVRVYTTDHSNNKIYYHDGYASHPLTRYTSGDNKGKIIDVGNSYRSAVSKAIKTACTRWGVALYLEENEDSNSEVTATATDFTPQFTKTKETPITKSEMTAAATDIDFVPILDIPIQPTNSVVKPKNPEKMERPMPWPDPPEIDTMKAEKNVYKTDTNPIFTNDTIVASQAFVGNMPDIPFNNQPQEEVKENYMENSVEKLTSVQKVAIETVMSVNNMKFEELVNKALQREGTLPSTIGDVNYLDAVTIIQYGNHLRPMQDY